MTTLAFRSPVTLPVHPKHWMRPPGNDDFRVTQQYDDVNAAVSPLPHRATDLGNFRCGDAVVAMESGSAETIGPDQYGALGVIVTHAGNVQTVYWHLNGFSIPRGSDVPVKRGQQIGIVGKTGIGAVCHLHVELKVNGVKRDPEPYIFGASLEIDDMEIAGKFLRHVTNSRAVLTTESNFRSGVIPGDDAPLAVMPAKTGFLPIAVVEGRVVGTAPDAGEWYAALNYVSADRAKEVGSSETGWCLGYYHSSVLPRTADQKSVALQTIHAADCSTQDEQLAQIRKGLSGLATSNGNEGQVIAAMQKVAG